MYCIDALFTLFLLSQLQPYGFGDFHWALTHLLAMIGAFFACLLIFAYEYEGSVTSEDGFRIEGVRLISLYSSLLLYLFICPLPATWKMGYLYSQSGANHMIMASDQESSRIFLLRCPHGYADSKTKTSCFS